VPQDALDGLADAEQPRGDLIALIVAAAPAAGGGRAKEATVKFTGLTQNSQVDPAV
jgi:hypothetical protein